METILMKLKAAVEEAQASLDKEAAEEEPEKAYSSMYYTALTSVTQNWNKVTALWQWLSNLSTSVRADIAMTLRKIIPIVNGFGDALPQSLQQHIKQFLLSLPSKWANITVQFASWTMTTAIFNPKSSLDQLDLLTDLVLDTKAVFRHIKFLVIQHLEQSGVPSSILYAAVPLSARMSADARTSAMAEDDARK